MKTAFSSKAAFAFLALAAGAAFGDAAITVDRVAGRYPWNGFVDVDYTVSGVVNSSDYVLKLSAVATVGGVERTFEPSTFLTCVKGDLPTSDGAHRVTWNAPADGASFAVDDLRVTATLEYAPAADGEFMVVDISAGQTAGATYPVRYLNGFTDTSVFNIEAYKTTKLVLKKVRRGTFLMGADDLLAKPEKGQWVRLTHDFFLGVFPLTQRQTSLVIGDACTRTSLHDDAPSDYMLWADSVMGKRGFVSNFVARVRYNGQPVEGFGPPTEAQWEYACRAGTRTKYWFGDSADSIGDYIWYGGNTKDESGSCDTQPVGTKPANPWGFYDILGSTREFCMDVAAAFNPGGSEAEPIEDPLLVTGGNGNHVRRGGNFDHANVSWCTSGFRILGGAEGQSGQGGLRLSLTVADLAETQVRAVVGEKVADDDAAGVRVDTCVGTVKVVVDASTLLPFAYNNSALWQAGGLDAGAAAVTVTPMAGTDPADPETWVAAGSSVTLASVPGEGMSSWRPARQSLYCAEHRDVGGNALIAYFDLRQAEGLARSIADASVELGTESVAFDGTPKTPTVTVVYGAKVLEEGVDYTLVYFDNRVPGTAGVRVSGIGDYGDEVILYFEIGIESVDFEAETAVSVDLRAAKIRGISDVSEILPIACNNSPTWPAGGVPTLELAQVSVTPMSAAAGDEDDPGRWEPAGSAEWLPVASAESTTVWEPAGKSLYRVEMMDGLGAKTVAYFDLRNATGVKASIVDEGFGIVLPDEAVYFDGTAKEPEVTVSDGVRTLTEGVDYTVSYSNNRGTGVATVTVTGKGAYGGTLAASFQIVVREQEFDSQVRSRVDLRPDDVLEVGRVEFLLPIAWNSTNTWARGGDSAAEARVSFAPMASAEAEPDESRCTTFVSAAGEGMRRWRPRAEGYYQFRLDYPDAAGSSCSRILHIQKLNGFLIRVK